MRNSTLEEQFETLRSMGKSWVGLAAQGIFVVPALVVFYKAFSLREYGLIPIGAGLLLFAAVVFQGMPHIRRAIQGIDSDDRCKGTAQISIEESSETTYYKALVTTPQRGRWVFHFQPQGWTPEEAVLTVECRFIRGVDWPVLLVAEAGLISPREVPKTLIAET
ncbi:hypothetical protein [Zoogloea sp.]|uniref:hypothetical protein n=1 Tax=Zoogloea sp. TaxID=49181 RepID=UPI0014165CB4|nr:MAG: hypothetical protein F9K15_20180 [Zoogloea sp.]